MKIEAFNLLAFGPFTDKHLDFSAMDNGIHLIYGRNEAGKSTSLRALIAWLYGFGHRVQDDWLHSTNKLAVSGCLALTDGRRLAFTRYKRRKNDLVDDLSGRPFDQSVLDRLLAGKTKDDFENAYGISHASLRKGVDSVLASGGELGQTLFAATSGLSVLKDVLGNLETLQSGLFTPRAQKAAINAGVSRLKELRKNIRNSATSHVQWRQKKKELDQHHHAKRRLEARLADLSKTISLQKRYRDALKSVTRLQQVDQDLEVLAAIALLREDFSQQRIQAQAAITESRQASKHLESELETITAQLSALTCDENILAARETIETLAADISVIAKASNDSKNLRAKIHQAERDAREKLALLRRDISLENAASMRLSKPDIGKLRRLANQYAKLEQSLETATESLKDAGGDLERLRTQLAQTGRPVDASPLQSCLDRFADHGNLESRFSEAQNQVETTKARIDKELASLGLWQGNLETLETLPLPTDASMRHYAARMDQLRHDSAGLESEMQKNRQALAEKQRELGLVSRNHPLPGPEDLQRRREMRDRGWRSVRAVWLDGAAPDTGFLSHYKNCGSLADAFEQSIFDADTTADTLRIQADAIARALALREDIDRLEQAFQELTKQQEALSQKQRGIQSRWLALWQPLGIEALSPAEMLDWVGRVAQIRRSAAEYHEKAARRRQLARDLENAGRDIKDALARVGIPFTETAAYGSLVDLARQSLQQNIATARKFNELEVRLQAAEDMKAQAHRQSEDIDHKTKQWASQWEKALEPLDLDPATHPDEVMEYLEALNEVFEKLDEAKADQQRVDAMTYNRQGFRTRVEAVVERLAPGLETTDPERTAAELKQMLDTNLQRRQKYEILAAHQNKKIERLEQEKQKLIKNQEILRQLCREAACDEPERLPEIEKQSSRKRQLLKDEDGIKERLAELAVGEALPSFIETVKQQDPDALAAALESAQAEKADLTVERDRLLEDIAVAQRELQQADGRSKAAQFALEADGVAARIAADVEHYIKLRLAAVVLASAIERYRKHNQNPVLEAAGGYFKMMTRGVFDGLKADFDDKGEPVLKAVRAADQSALGVDDLSDGTQDQLFLALRLGGLQRHVENRGRMPFIVDDVLVHFDDDRASAALEAMAGLAGKTQIIFFTHHKHLIGLAQGAVDERRLCLHRL